MIYENITQMVGNTPIFKVPYNDGLIYVKLEKYNPLGSIKDRAVYNMLKEMINNGEVKPGDTICEASSGNTGIALAGYAKQLGLKAIVVMMENMTIERKNIIKALGATLVLSDASKGMQGAIDLARKLVEEKGYKTLGQFDNINNPLAHFATAREIVEEVPKFDFFVAGFGTAGTISGVSKYLKDNDYKVITVGVEPEESPAVSKKQSGKHGIAGIGAGFIPENLWINNIDLIETVSTKEAYDAARWFSSQTGILVGISTGANLAMAKKLVKKGIKVVTVSPDSGERYLSTELYV